MYNLLLLILFSANLYCPFNSDSVRPCYANQILSFDSLNTSNNFFHNRLMWSKYFLQGYTRIDLLESCLSCLIYDSNSSSRYTAITVSKSFVKHLLDKTNQKRIDDSESKIELYTKKLLYYIYEEFRDLSLSDQEWEMLRNDILDLLMVVKSFYITLYKEAYKKKLVKQWRSENNKIVFLTSEPGFHSNYTALCQNKISRYELDLLLSMKEYFLAFTQLENEVFSKLQELGDDCFMIRDLLAISDLVFCEILRNLKNNLSTEHDYYYFKSLFASTLAKFDLSSIRYS